MTTEQLNQLSINTIHTLSMDAVQEAKSGHPGTPMALAPLIYTLWNRVMRFDPQNPIWPNRDRFVLSNGYASMLLWSVLHFTEDVSARFLAYGWNVQRVGDANDIDRIERALDVFRQTRGRRTFIILDSHIGSNAPSDTCATRFKNGWNRHAKVTPRRWTARHSSKKHGAEATAFARPTADGRH
jgi:transketolase